MKNKSISVLKRIFCILAAVVLIFCFVACSSAAPDEGGGSAESPEMGENGDVIVNDELNRKIVYTVSMSIECKDVQGAKAEITADCKALGGYVESNSETYDDGECERVYVTYRIPTENLDSFVGEVESNGGVQSKNVSTKDITATYVDAVAKKQSLLERKQLLEETLAQDSVETSDKITLINEISLVNQELKEIELLINDYDSQVEYSTVSVSISQKTEFSEVIVAVLIVAATFLTPFVLVIIILIIAALIVKSIIKSVKKKNA